MWIISKLNKHKSLLLLVAVILFGCFVCLVSFSLWPAGLLLNLLAQSQAPSNLTEEIIPQEPNCPVQADTYLTATPLATLVSSETDSPTECPTEEMPLEALQENALLANLMPVTIISQAPRDEIMTYLVESGDIPSVIAAQYGITTQTLLWANKLKETSLIRPGDELIVLPVSGVLHRVKDGQTIGWIAQYYKADENEIIAFNDLPADGSIQIGQELVIPGGQMPAPARPAPVYVAAVSYSGPGTGQSHNYPYGQCTWYVAQKRYIPWSGHAYTWLAQARQYGWQTGAAPQVGAIIVTRESWYGHVGYVESIQGEWVTFSEMNHLGWGIKDVRTLHINDYRIRGYIY